MKFDLSSTPIEQINLKNYLRNAEAGALCTFEGIVRNHNDGRKVTALEYEAYSELCQSEVKILFKEIRRKFDVIDAHCIHRIGRLRVGEMAVWIGVTSAHRDAAYRASRYLIDQLKFRLPIWKKEFYVNGESGWINCQQSIAPSFDSKQYYSRQIILKNIGEHGQHQLQSAKVLVVGAGGLGSAVLMGLAGSGVGTLGICEFDRLDESNLHRQFLYSHRDIGKPKIELATQRILALNPTLTVCKHPFKVTPENLDDLLSAYDIIVDCTDNFKAKFLLSDGAFLLNKPLVQASIYQYDGQVHTYVPQQSGCLRCLWPDTVEPNCVGNCAEAGVLGDVAAALGHIQSMETIKLILGQNQDIGKTMIYNFSNHSIEKISRPQNPECPVCGVAPSITTLVRQNYQIDHDVILDIETLGDHEIMNCSFIDVRESHESEISPLNEVDCLNLPLSQYSPEDVQIDATKRYLVFCAKGMRSLVFTKALRQAGMKNVFSLDNDFKQIQTRFQKINQNSCSS